MARYIDADVLTKWLKVSIKSWSADSNSNVPAMVIAYRGILHILKDITTADVVPKREYDAAVSAVDNSTKEFLKLHDDYQEAKSEVEDYKHNWQKIHDSYNEDCLEHYNKGQQDAAREIFEEIERLSKILQNDYRSGNSEAAEWVEYATDYFLYELKKKYSEEKK